MHVYTMGTRAYAEEVCKAIDPDGKFFSGRILSRDESGSRCSALNLPLSLVDMLQGLTQKSLQRLFPVDTSMVVIIDDRADVWEWSPNLVKVAPCLNPSFCSLCPINIPADDFFVGIVSDFKSVCALAFGASQEIGDDNAREKRNDEAAFVLGIGVGLGINRVVMILGVNGIDGDERHLAPVLASCEARWLRSLGFRRRSTRRHYSTRLVRLVGAVHAFSSRLAPAPSTLGNSQELYPNAMGGALGRVVSSCIRIYDKTR